MILFHVYHPNIINTPLEQAICKEWKGYGVN